jgi:Protein of unknown function (DUF3618)
MTESNDPDELRQQIEHTRDELAGTVQALAEKADVKSRAKLKVSELTTQAKDYGLHAREAAVLESRVAREQITRTQAETPWLLPSAGGAAVVSVAVWVWFLVRRRRS